MWQHCVVLLLKPSLLYSQLITITFHQHSTLSLTCTPTTSRLFLYHLSSVLVLLRRYSDDTCILRFSTCCTDGLWHPQKLKILPSFGIQTPHRVYPLHDFHEIFSICGTFNVQLRIKILGVSLRVSRVMGGCALGAFPPVKLYVLFYHQKPDDNCKIGRSFLLQSGDNIYCSG